MYIPNKKISTEKPIIPPTISLITLSWLVSLISVLTRWKFCNPEPGCAVGTIVLGKILGKSVGTTDELIDEGELLGDIDGKFEKLGVEVGNLVGIRDGK